MKERLFYALLGVFVLWLAVLLFLVMRVIANPAVLDPMMTMVAGLSVGAVTEFFIVALTLSWQYFYRKKSPAP